MTALHNPAVSDAAGMDIVSAISDAEKQTDAYLSTDPIYAELMATYVELGGVLQDSRHITAVTAQTLPPSDVRLYTQDCNALVARLIALGNRFGFEVEQAWARWCLHNMNMDGIA